MKLNCALLTTTMEIGPKSVWRGCTMILRKDLCIWLA
jgi:hypothetical protein